MTDLSKDNAARKRILDHMNADHQDSLSRYLEHYCRLSSWAARNAKATEITLSQLDIDASGKTHQVPLNPPLGSFRDARERMVKMDQDSLKGLSRSDIKVTEYQQPKGFDLVVFSAVVLTLLAYCKRSNFLPGSWLYDNLLSNIPGFARFSFVIQPLVFYGIIVIHSIETAFMVSSRLNKHSVPIYGGLWWKWTLTTFIDGICSFRRFAAIVERKKREKEKQRH
ncbi:hypothetical protein EV356DRAFT_574895 [Viridothelium virens]|uniref:DUF2470 domain-containing protein n=1 Tax=Viridothelium virens TaxID=1048519 RepID=A0A6A6HEW0_VIRVR|nr:hypothetical protein EV356DRAFT_574895 [Viridothelium virens]